MTEQTRSKRGLLHSTAVVSANTLASRVLGLARDLVVARAFGAGTDADAFLVAFRIPSLFRRLFAEGAFAQAFVPVLAEIKQTEGEQSAREMVRCVAMVLGAAVFVISVLGMIFSPVLIGVFAPGFDQVPEKAQLSADLLRLCFPYLFFISMTALAGAILNSYGNFAVPAFTPVLLNVCLIGAALGLAPYLERPIEALAVGVFVAGAVQLLFQFPFLARLGYLLMPVAFSFHAGVKKILKLMLPALFGVSVAQINILVSTVLASRLENGSVTWLYFADRMLEFPLGIFGIALATVILPKLSSQYVANQGKDSALTLDWALRVVFLIALPATAGLALLSTPIICTLFQYGAFTERDALKSSAALIAFSSGLTGYILVKVFASAYFSRQDTKTPVRVAAASVLFNVALSLALVGAYGHVGLALANALSAWVNASLLYWGIRHRRLHTVERNGAGERTWTAWLGRLIVATGLMITVLVVFVPGAQWWFSSDVAHRITGLAGFVGLGALVYVIALYLSGLRPREIRPPSERNDRLDVADQ